MTEIQDTSNSSTRLRDEDGSRVRFRGIVESDQDGKIVVSEESRALALGGQTRAQTRNWERLSVEVANKSRLFAGFILASMLVGWPIGTIVGSYSATGQWLNLPLNDIFPTWAIIFAVVAPIIIYVLGWMLSHVMRMMGAAEEIADTARQLTRPDDAAVFNVESVGASVRSQMDAINSGIDDALIRLASVEAMIRRHVDAIEKTGVALEERTQGASERIATERARLMELTEFLNSEADVFATAIAEKAQASIEGFTSANALASKAETKLEARLGNLEDAARRALESFEALNSALGDAGSKFTDKAALIEKSTESTRRASLAAASAANEAAESAARNVANVGMSAMRASEEAKKVAELAIETARSESERASREAVNVTRQEAAKVAEAAARAIENVRASTGQALKSASEDAEKAIAAADTVSEAAMKAVRAAETASSEVKRVGDDARTAASDALKDAEATAERVEERNRELARARAALEEENKRLETLIDEQRKRADRLADAIATQTERLSKLAEAQLREQETSARLAETQAAMQAQQLAAKKAEEERAAALARKEAEEKAAYEAEQKAQTAKRQEVAARAEKERFAAIEAGREEKRRQEKEMLTHVSTRTKPSSRRDEKEINLAELADKIETSKRPARDTEPRRQKEGVSWREILTATDDAAPLNLAKANTGDDKEAKAVQIIERLQNFTLNLERRLYGEPPATLLGRFDNGDRNVFANRLLRLNEADVKRRIRIETGRDRVFERGLHEFLQGFEGLLEEATTSESADEELEEYLSSPLGRVYLLIGATVGYFA